MMARNKGWLSGAIRIFFVAALCVTWSNHGTGKAQEQLDPVPGGGELTPQTPEPNWELIGTLAQDILTAINQERYRETIETLRKRNEHKADLQDDELAYKYFYRYKIENDKKYKAKAGEKLSEELQKEKQKEIEKLEQPGNVREELIKQIEGSDKNTLTIAVGVDQAEKEVVVAGNIKKYNYFDLKVAFQKSEQPTGGDLKRAMTAVASAKIVHVGFQTEDHDIIKDIVAKAYPGFKVTVLSPSSEQMDRYARKWAVNVNYHQAWVKYYDQKFRNPGKEPPIPQLRDWTERTTDEDVLKIKSQFHHAEMQIKVFYEKYRGGYKGKEIKASKEYCRFCRKEIKGAIDKTVRKVLNKVTRWAIPKDVDRVELGVPPVPVNEHAVKKEAEIERAQDNGAHCTGGSGRRRRGVCSSLEDFTEINADEVSEKLKPMTDADRFGLLSVLDRVGMEKLGGSESAVMDVTGAWKKWKISTAKEIMEAVSKGTVNHGRGRGGTTSVELERAAISRHFLLQSLNNLHESELDSLSQDYEAFRNGEAEEYPKSMRGLGASYKFVKTVNLAMFGKDLIGGILEGDAERTIKLMGIFAADRVLTHTGEIIVAKGVDMVQAGRKAMGTAFKVTGPIVGSLSIGFSMYKFVGDVNQLNYLEKFCHREDAFFKDRLEKDCKFDMDIGVANVVADEVAVASGVAITAETIMGALAVETGPVGLVIAAADVVVFAGSQIYSSVKTIDKISSSIVGGLTPSEEWKIFWDSIVGVRPPENIQELLDLKRAYDEAVQMAAKALEQADKFQTYVCPTFRPESDPPQFQDNSDANFLDTKELNRFRVEPDAPSWGTLECKPSSVRDAGYSDDPEYSGYEDGLLCHNVIAITAPDRSDLPVLVDLKDGEDTILGFPDRQHVFLVEDGTKNFTGGAADDVFFIQGKKFLGQLDGGEGMNTLVVTSETESDIRISNYCWQTSCTGVVSNIQHFVGRPGRPEYVLTDCSWTSYIDLKGGHPGDPDLIILNSTACTMNITLQLHNFTEVQVLFEQKGIYTYRVEFGPQILVMGDFRRTGSAVNQFIFSDDIYTANLTYLGQGTNFRIKNQAEGKYFMSTFTPCDENVTFMTESGLIIRGDESCSSFYGLALLRTDTKRIDGFTMYPNRFIFDSDAQVPPDSWLAKGGDQDDILSINGSNHIKGLFHGGSGTDSIVIQPDYFPTERVHINLDGSDHVLGPESPDGFNGDISFTSVENFIGRHALPDSAVVNCDFHWLDLKGGSDMEKRDVVQIVSVEPSCTPKISIMVNSFTSVCNDATSGEFNYIIDVESPQTSNISVNAVSDDATHNYIFNTTGSSVVGLDFDQASSQLTVQFQDGSSFAADMLPTQSKIYLTDGTAVQLTPFVQGVLEAKSASVVTNSGLRGVPNTFLLYEAPEGSTCTGGEKDDTFILKSEDFHGQINGGEGGNDSIVLGNEVWKDRSVIIDANAQTVSVMKRKETEYQIQLRNISLVFGREEQPDGVFAGCDTTLIDTRGASSSYDLIQISPDLDCHFELGMVIRPNLVIFNDAQDGGFVYEGNFTGGKTFIFLTPSQFANHDVILTMNFLQLGRIQMDENRVNMTALDGSQFSTDVFFDEDEHTQSQPSIVFMDGLQLKISEYGSTVYGVLQNVEPSDVESIQANPAESELIQRYKDAAKATHTNVVMEVEKGKLVSIGSGGRIEVLTAVPGYEKNILVSNDAVETIYRIVNDTSAVLILSNREPETRKLLDFTPIVHGDPLMVPTIDKNGDDLRFSINGVQVTIAGLADQSHGDLESWQVFLRDAHLNIEEDEGDFKLVPPTILVQPTKHDTVVLHIPHLESNTKITTVDDSHPIVYELLKKGDDLVFTNLFQPDSKTSVATLVFQDFYNPSLSDILTAKNLSIETQPGTFMSLTSDAGENIKTFEERESEFQGPLQGVRFIKPHLRMDVMEELEMGPWEMSDFLRFILPSQI